MQSQELTYKAIYAKLAKRTEKYAADVRNVFLNGMGEIAKLCEGIEIPEGEVFHFNDYPEIATQVQERLRSMYSELYQCVRGDIVREWYYANDDVDRLVKAMFGKQAAEQPHFAKYFQRNKQAMDAFFERKQQGLSLSQRVWKYIGEGKEELELALDLGLGAGKDADELSREVRHLLQNPDKLFRRVRNKHGELVLSKAAKAYHPGQGVYRSSYKNAMRLTRTETNMAYRTADITRWQQLPFVVGYEVKISKKHPYPDICDDLAGKYPKGFLFKGWHPHCYCYIVPILCTDKELEELTGRILEGTEAEFTPAGVVQDVPAAFTNWIEQNAERIESASSLPYFIRDNYPKGDISKAGNWVKAGIANEPSMGSFAQVVAKQEVDLQMFSKVQPYTNEAWQGMSNFVPADAEELELLLGKSTAGFDSMYVANDATMYAELLEWAKKGYAEPWKGWVDTTMLEELKAVTYKAKFASKQEGRFIASMERSRFEGCISSAGKEVQLQGVSKWGTNYSKAAGKAIAAEDEQVLVVVKTPAGSRYVQTMAGEEQQAVFMPNTKYKVVGKVEKTVIQQGKASKVLQYEMELVEDGSTMAEELLIKQAEVQSELAKHTKAVKVANNVVKAARKGKYELLGIDADELEDMLGEGVATSAEIKSKTEQMAKEMAAAKKAALLEAKEKPNLWQLTQEFGEADANGFMANWQKHMAKSSIYTDDAIFLKKVIDKELYYAGLNPNKYATTPKFIEYMQKLKVQYEAKIQLAAVQGDISDIATFASTCKPNAKIHTMVKELLHAAGSTTPDIAAIQNKLAEAQKEMQRLKNERLKLLKKKGDGGYDIEQFYSPADKAKLDSLRMAYEDAIVKAKGDLRSYSVESAQRKLADFTVQMGNKYANMQPTLTPLRGVTESQAKQALKEYLAETPINPRIWKAKDLSKLTPAQTAELKQKQDAIWDAWSKLQKDPTSTKLKSALRAARDELDDFCYKLPSGTFGSDYVNGIDSAFGLNIGGSYDYLRGRCEKLSKTLAGYGLNVTWEELSLITRYCHGSNFVNHYCFGIGAIHNCIDPVIKKELADIVERYIPAINNVMERMPRYNGITFRGVDIYPAAIKDPTKDGFWNSIMQAWSSKDKVWVTPNPTSSTYVMSIADSFANGTMNKRKGQRVIMKIHGKTGVDVQPISPYGSEAEIMFRAGSKFRMLKAPYKCTTAGIGMVGDWVVELEEILD